MTDSQRNPLQVAQGPRRFPRLPTCLLVLTSLLPLGCDRTPAFQAPPPAAVTVTKPLQREVTDWDEYPGHLQSPQTANVAARISGFITEAPFKEGSLVQKGDVLFVVDDRPYKADLDNKKAAVAKDEAQVVFAKTQLARYEDLLKKHTIAQQDYDTAKASCDQALAQTDADKAAVETSQLNLDWTRVTAPISGRVGRIAVTVGNLVNGGAGQATMLTTVVSIDPVYCYVSVPERSFLKYQSYAMKDKQTGVRDAKIPCFVRLENESNFPHEGVIDFIDNSIDTRTGTIQVRGVIPNHDGALTPGLFAAMRITGSGPYKTMLIPDLAVGTEQNERYVLVVGPDNVVSSEKVELGLLFGKMRSIVSGLNPGDRVVINGIQQARPGAKVNPTEAPISPKDLREMEAAASGAADAPLPAGSETDGEVPKTAKAQP